MLSLLLTLFFQTGFQAAERINLEFPDKPIPLNNVAVSDDLIVVFAEGQQSVYAFDHGGAFKFKLNDKAADQLGLPWSIAWIPQSSQVIVYDVTPTRDFIFFNSDGSYNKTTSTDLDMFFQVGSLTKVGDGYVAPVSLTDENKLLVRFNSNFNIVGYNLNLMGSQLADMSPEVRKSYVDASGEGEQTRVFAAQSLEPRLHVYDVNMNRVATWELKTPEWYAASLMRLSNISRNPKELRKYKKRYSEVVGISALAPNRALVVFRNVSAGAIYFYQIYDTDTGEATGQPMSAEHSLLARHNSHLYLGNRTQSGTEIQVYKVQ